MTEVLKTVCDGCGADQQTRAGVYLDFARLYFPGRCGASHVAEDVGVYASIEGEAFRAIDLCPACWAELWEGPLMKRLVK